MKIIINIDKSLQENASRYFEKAKNAKKNTKKIKKLIELTKKEIKKTNKTKTIKQEMLKKRKTEWFEKFHWCFTSEGLLIIAGRDSKTNELIVKKYMEKNDLYFHSDIQGAAHCILKNGIIAGEKSLKEAAVFAAVFSKAWKLNFSAVDVYSVKPEQVSKKAPSGEALGTGAFMIYGERKWFKNTSLNFAVGIEKKDDYYRIISGPVSSIEKNAVYSIKVRQGKKKKSETAKKIKYLFEKKINVKIDINEIMRMLPEAVELIE